MTSVLRHTREPTFLHKRFTVFPYLGGGGGEGLEYYFTVRNNSLYRIENDLSGNGQWVVARDMGKEEVITSIDTEIIEWWETNYSWSNISVVRNGRARKFQALAITKGFGDVSLNNGPAWNAGGYTDPGTQITNSYFNNQLMPINDPLIMGTATGTTGEYTESLPWATFYAVTDPVVIQYTYDDDTYTRAIVNRVVPS
jgi:hypothetical protein